MSRDGLDHRAFAEEWVAAWNSHDLTRILSYYDENVILVSPKARSLFGKADATVRGKTELRKYFGSALQRIPDLKFTLHTVYAGAESVVLQYSSYDGRSAAEYMAFGDNGLVLRVAAHYAE